MKSVWFVDVFYVYYGWYGFESLCIVLINILVFLGGMFKWILCFKLNMWFVLFWLNLVKIFVIFLWICGVGVYRIEGFILFCSVILFFICVLVLVILIV